MSASFYDEIYRLQARNHQEQRAQAQYDLQIAETQGDAAGGAEAAQRLLCVEESWKCFNDGAHRHAASMIPPVENPKAWSDKRTDQLNDLDAFRMITQTSKYGADITPQEYEMHMRERDRRVASGHYQGGRVGR